MTTALITGANRGIGLELCRQLKRRGHTVIGVCRHSSPELDKLEVRVEADVDVTAEKALVGLAGRLKDVTLDIIMCNAGILKRETLENLELRSIEEQLRVNAVGPLLTVHALLGSTKRGTKIGLVTSRMGSMADNTSGGYYGYRMSKAALNAAGVSLSHDLRPRGVAVAILHPGYVRTDMTDGQGDVAPSEAASNLIARMDELSLDTSGTFWHANGERLPW